MEELTIKMTVFQRSNLLQFLQRVDLKGSEVEAFVEVVQLLKEEVKEIKK